VERDRDFIERCRQGDVQALRDLTMSHQDAVFRLALHLLRDPDHARDAAQDVFLNVFRALPGFRGDSAIKTWIMRIARNECMSRIDSQTRWRNRIVAEDSVDGYQQGIESIQDTQHDELYSVEVSNEVRRSVAELSEPYRSAIALRYFAELSYEEIADALDSPLGTIKAWIHRGKTLLRNKLATQKESLR
jgi:RNA polymerase sigma-70 factor, ECF subfamily